ncbi:MAG: hypothetical protein GY940_11140 [bacterium]|nr:hypothetical protein [bacterium]
MDDGTIEFLGRTDSQVKVRGFRVELGEIETRLRAHPYVKDAAVIVAEPEPGEKKLAAYIVNDPSPAKEKETAELSQELRSYLKDKLPEYMVPTFFILIESLPLTSSGKLNRQALPHPNRATSVSSGDSQMIKPRTKTETLFAGIWKDILLLDELGINDNFFGLGGDSVNAIQVVSRAKKRGFNLSVQDLYRNVTIMELARYADTLQPETTEPPEPRVNETGLAITKEITKEDVLVHLPAGTEIEDIFPLTPFQQHMMTIYLRDPGNANEGGLYVNQVFMPWKGEITDPSPVKRVIQRLTDDHSYLRTAFWWQNIPQPVQVVYKTAAADFQYYDWSHYSAEEQDRRLKDFIEQENRRGFDRQEPVVYRVVILKLAFDYSLNIQTSDLMRVDGWSAMNIGNKFSEYLFSPSPRIDTAANAGYKEYHSWLSGQDITKGDGYFKRMLPGCKLPTPIASCTPNNGGKKKESGFAVKKLNFSEEETTRIDRFLSRHQLVLSALGCAVWGFLVSHYTAIDGVVFGMLFSGRGSALTGVESMMGQAMNVLPLRLDVDYDKPVVSWLREVWERVIELNRYEHCPLDRVKGVCGVPGDVELFESYFVIENFPGLKEGRMKSHRAGLELGGKYTAKMEYPLLRVVLLPYVALELTIQYYLRIYTDDAIQGMIDDYHRVLLAIVENPDQPVKQLKKPVTRSG